MKVALYARVSTDDKDQDPERQLIKCRQYAELHNHEVLGEFTDKHTGDSNPADREGFKALLEKVPEGVVVYSIDRLSRQHPSKIMNLLMYYKASGKKIISVTEPIFNAESDFSEPMQYFLTWWNNYFLKKLKADIKSGLDKARAEGKILGRPKASFNQRRAYNLLFVEKVPIRKAAEEIGVSVGVLHRSKKVWEINPPSFINKPVIHKSDDKKTSIEVNHE